MTVEPASALAKLEARTEVTGSLLCVGLDADIARIPLPFRDVPQPQFAFNRWLIEQTHPYVCAYKPNMAFYEARGAAGREELGLTMAYLQANHPDIVTIADAKRGDIDNTNQGYVTDIFDVLGFDMVTLHPYLGERSLLPFLQRADRGCIILCRTSNAGAEELQNLDIGGQPLWERIAERVRDQWNARGNCLLVIGATRPTDVRRARALCPQMTFLVPGVGAQGGDLAEVLQAGADARGRGLIINVGRSIIFATDPCAEAQRLRVMMVG